MELSWDLRGAQALHSKHLSLGGKEAGPQKTGLGSPLLPRILRNLGVLQKGSAEGS